MARAARFAALALSALAFAACGGGSDGADTGAGAAAIVPASAALYASIVTDEDAEAFDRLEALLQKFPDGERLLDRLRGELAREENLNWERDVQPALGETLDVVVLTFDDDPTVVGILKPRDREKLEQLLAKGDEPAVHREIEGWTVVSDTQAALDRFENARSGSSLEDDDRFQGAMEGLPEDPLATVYVNGDAATEAARREGAATGNNRLTALAFAFAAESTGFRLEGRVKAELDPEYRSLEAYSPEFLADVPADAFLFASYNGYGKLAEAVRDVAAGDDVVGQLKAFLGVDVDELASLFDGEIALYVRPGSPIPEVTLLLEAAYEERALAILDRLADRAARFTGAEQRRTTVDGVAVRQVLVQGLPISYGSFEGRVIVTSGPGAISALREDGDKLVDDPDFERAKEAAGMPDETFGFFYVDVEQALDLLVGFAGIAGERVPDDVRRNLEPLGPFLSYTGGEPQDAEFSAFLVIE